MYFPIISEAEMTTLKYYKKYHTSWLIRLRMQVVELRCRRMAAKDIVQLLDVHPSSITNWVKMYIADGVKGLLKVESYRPQSDLVTYRDQILEAFKKQAPTSIGQAAKRITQLTGLSRGLTQIRYFLKNVFHFRYRKYRRTSGGVSAP